MRMKHLDYLFECEVAFGDIISVEQLHQNTGLSVTTIYNAIARGKILARKLDGEEFEKGGHWILSLKSCKKCWPKKFTEDD